MVGEVLAHLGDHLARDGVGLAARGIRVPAETHFAPGEHDTALDVIRWFDLEGLGAEIMVHLRVEAPVVDWCDPDAVEEAGGESSANAVGRFHPRSRVRPGQTAEIAVAVENLHFFDFDTREAIWD